MNWNAILKWGGILGALCVAVQLLMAVTGWYADPVLASLFFVVVLINIVVIVLGLRATRADSGYGKQLLNGLLMGLVGGLIIVAGSLLVTGVLVPDYSAEMADMQQLVLTERGMDEATVRQIAERTRNTPGWMYAVQGLVGTLVTSLVTAGIAAIWLRRKGQPLEPSTAPQ